jgi:hypothetical protein
MADEVITSVVGGVGNQLFCWATAMAVARRVGVDTVLDVHSYERDPFGRTYMLSKLGIADVSTTSYNTAERIAIPLLTRIANRRNGHCGVAGRHVYTDIGGRLNSAIMENKLSGKCYLRGYWQSARYFGEFAGKLRSAVKFEPCNSVQPDGETVCVHIRSFKEDCSVGRLDRDYYVAAYARCLARYPNARFDVFSDDLNWAEEKGMLPTEYGAGQGHHRAGCSAPDLCELVTMKRYRNFIIANSTFSWWAAYLADESSWVQAPGPNRHAWFSEDPLPSSWEAA